MEQSPNPKIYKIYFGKIIVTFTFYLRGKHREEMIGTFKLI